MWDLFLNPIELFATVTGILSVYFSYRKNILTYFFGLLSVSIYIYICYQVGIYAEMGINIFYFVMSIYGWWNWHREAISESSFVAYDMSMRYRFICIFATFLFWIGLYFILIKMTDSNVPLLDSFTTALFIMGMILMAKKFSDNWIYLLIGNLISIPLFIYKELYVSSVFFVILSIFAWMGYKSWRINEKK